VGSRAHPNEVADRTPSLPACLPAGLLADTRSTMNLVDLAGSERQRQTKSSKQRLWEAQHINKSLSALSHCISQLSQSSGEASSATSAGGTQGGSSGGFVNYRDSKLTYLLRDSLGGNGKTWVVAAVSAASACSAETLSTLNFARSAKMIRCAGHVSEGITEPPCARACVCVSCAHLDTR
jgi:kinesin family protein 15